MSYVNDDDKYANGKITQFRKYLSRAVKAHSGKPFEIVQDKEDIKWGQPWQERINDSLDATLFLIPIITPSFFNSPACQEELERFLKREEKLGRGDLILPVYYFDCPVLNDKGKLKQDHLAEIIASRQREDWRELRHHSFNTRKLNKALEKMARQIMAALERSEAQSARAAAQAGDVPEETLRPKQDGTASASNNIFTNTDSGDQNIAQGNNAIGAQINNYYTPSSQDLNPQPIPAVKTGPLTVIVDAMCRGDYTTITEALKEAVPGSRIFVRPGLYREGIVIDKPVEIIGDGDRDKIVVEASGEDTICFIADMGRVSNLTLRQSGDDKRYGVNIIKGRLELEDCDISSQNFTCVAIHGTANPILRCNRIHDGKESGIVVWDKCQGTIEDNEIVFNVTNGVVIASGCKPILRRNRISQNGWKGIRMLSCAGGIFEDNDLLGNTKGAWDIAPDCEANVQRRGNKE
jgi:F-box protein 11